MFPSLKEVVEILEDNIKEVDRLRFMTLIKIPIYLALIPLGAYAGIMILMYPAANLSNQDIFATIGVFAFSFFLVFAGVKIRLAIKNYRNEFKKLIVVRVIRLLVEKYKPSEELGDYSNHWSYRPYESIDKTHIMSCGLFPTDANRFRGEDYVYGQIGLTEFHFSELRIGKETTSQFSSGNKSKYKRIFRGILFLADFHKHFHGQTYLRNRGVFGFSYLKWRLSNLFGSRRFQTIKLENQQFNKYFMVRTTDEIEARYILSPVLMNKLVEFRETHRKPISISFSNEYMGIAVPTIRDYFEPSFIKPMKKVQVATVYHDMKFFFEMIEQFQLNKRIWSKQ